MATCYSPDTINPQGRPVQPWQMAPQDYAEYCARRYADVFPHQTLCPLARRLALEVHRYAVHDALVHGEGVSFEVVRFYPAMLPLLPDTAPDDDTDDLD